MIIALIGEKLSGKDTVGEYLVEKHRAEEIKFSDIIREILALLDIEISRTNITSLITSLRQIFGPGILMRSVEKKITSSPAQLILLNGVRFQEELDHLRTLGTKLVYVTAPLDIRYQRFMARRENSDDGKQTEAEFLAGEQSPTERYIGDLGKQADMKIENTGTLDELHEKIETMLGSLD